MRQLSQEFINRYVNDNWHSIQHSVGAYKLEEQGVRLISKVDGDYFNVLGLPLIEIISFFIENSELEI